jgi:carbamoyl-phosphate synthase large subunit
MKRTNKPVILVSAVCGDIGCSAVRALQRAAGRIIGCDMKTDSPVEKFLERLYQVPGTTDSEAYLERLKEIVSKERVSFFLPISEPEIRLVDERREELEALGLKLLLNNRTIVRNFLDKIKTVQYLASIGVRTPKTELLSKYDEGISFPLIIKSRTGYGSKRLWRAETREDIDYLRRKDDGSLIVQEYLGTDSEEYTTGVFSDGSKVSSITFKRRLGFGGLSAEAILAHHQDIDRVAKKVALAVNLKGSINIQGRLVGRIFIPFEINPRLSSTLLIRKRFGFNDTVWWLNMLSGKPYRYQETYRSGKVVRYVSESYFGMVKLEKC